MQTHAYKAGVADRQKGRVPLEERNGSCFGVEGFPRYVKKTAGSGSGCQRKLFGLCKAHIEDPYDGDDQYYQPDDLRPAVRPVSRDFPCVSVHHKMI